MPLLAVNEVDYAVERKHLVGADRERRSVDPTPQTFPVECWARQHLGSGLPALRRNQDPPRHCGITPPLRRDSCSPVASLAIAAGPSHARGEARWILGWSAPIGSLEPKRR